MTPSPEPDWRTFDHPDALREDGLPRGPLSLPTQILDEFEIDGLLEEQGSEGATLFRARRIRERDLVVLKLYPTSLDARADVLGAIKGRELPHIAALLDFDTVEGIGYEVIEFIQGGTLPQFIASLPGPPDDDIIESIVREIALALGAFHSLTDPAELAHGDIKPDNILVRATSPLDLVLADFGRATRRRDTSAGSHPNPWWAAPEAAATEPEGDWWSLGCIVYWLLTGRRPYDDVSDRNAVVDLQIASRFPVHALPSRERDWPTLVKGLTSRDTRLRWGREEVLEWLSGGSPALPDDWLEPTVVTIVAQPPPRELVPIRFGGRDHHSLPELAAALAADWDRATAVVGSVHGAAALSASIADHAGDIRDVDLAADCSRLLLSEEPAERRLAALVTRLDPALGPTFRGFDVSRPGLVKLADDAAGHPRDDAAAAVSSLLHDGILSAYVGAEGAAGYDDLAREWADEVDFCLRELSKHDVALSPEDERTVESRILLVVLDPRARERLARELGRLRRSRLGEIEWFRPLADSALSPGRAMAAIALAPRATAAADVIRAERSARAAAMAAERAAASAARLPRTTTMLGWSLVPLAFLAAAGLVLHVLPTSSGTPFMRPVEWARLLTGELQSFAPWLVAVTVPSVVLPVLLVGWILWVRGRRSVAASRSRAAGATPAALTRHPWERRAMQAVIAYVAVLLPLLIPIVIWNWVLGLRRHAPDELLRRSGIRTASLLLGTLGLTGMLLILWRLPPLRMPGLLASVGPQWDLSLVGATDQYLPWLWDPLRQAYENALSSDASPYLWAVWGGASFSAISLAAAGADYCRRRSFVSLTMWCCIAPTAAAALTALMVFVGLGRSGLVDLAILVAALLAVRHRWRTRNRVTAREGSA